MYKVCILDDQPIVREGLKTIIDWNSLDCEIVGVWGTAVSAVRELEKLRPDLIISDIVMPGLDGLTMMEMLNQMGLAVKVIFLSAHRNFEYAHRAIELGAVDYLVKPTDPKEVVRAVLKCIQRIDAERNRLQVISSVVQDKTENRREKAMLSLLIHDERIDEETLFDKKLSYVVMAVHFEDSSNISKRLERSIELIQRKLKQVSAIDIVPIMDKVIIVFGWHEEDALQKQIMEWAEEIQFWHRQFLDATVSIGISNLSKGTEQLHRQYMESLKALEKTFYYGKGFIFTASEFNTNTSKSLGDIPSHLEYVVSSKEELLLNTIQQADKEKMEMLLDEWFSQFVKEEINPNEIKFEVYKWIFYAAPHVPLEAEDKRIWEKQAQSILATNSLVEIRKLLQLIVELMFVPYKSDLTNHHQRIIYQVEQYIKQHYHYPESSLMAVSEHIHLTANYVSRLIKRKIGKTFTEWLNEYRMEEAKKLLLNKNNKSYWVAEKVGIQDARYFSQLFRKYTNMTPSEYKNQTERV
jgi:two-component system response regulator YesN